MHARHSQYDVQLEILDREKGQRKCRLYHGWVRERTRHVGSALLQLQKFSPQPAKSRKHLLIAFVWLRQHSHPFSCDKIVQR